jgi:hypothetical protein
MISFASRLALVPTFVAGAVLATTTAAAADPREARATLEQVCREDGMATETCSCLGDFVEANFSARELEGAALVFSDPQLTADPGAAIGALLEEGYSIEEITAVAERVMSLEQAATQTCAVDDEAARSSAPGER